VNDSYLVLLALFIFSLMIRTGYELLKRAGKVNPKNKLLFFFIFVIMFTLWASWFEMCPLDPFKIALPVWIIYAGLGLFSAGLILALGSLFQLRGLENIDHLVTTGFFSIIRHPMYTGFILFIVGWSIYHGAVLSFLFGLVGIVNILYWQHLEENELLDTYSKQYVHYRHSTWF